MTLTSTARTPMRTRPMLPWICWPARHPGGSPIGGDGRGPGLSTLTRERKGLIMTDIYQTVGYYEAPYGRVRVRVEVELRAEAPHVISSPIERKGEIIPWKMRDH